MATHILSRAQKLNANLDDVWAFYSSPENLDALTPDNMGFRIITPRPLPNMYQGQEIEYKVSPLLKIPLYWKTRITKVQDKVYFIDEQLKGPYKLWRHTHTFKVDKDQVHMEDKVEYALPFGFLGDLVVRFYIKKRLAEIFDYRAMKTDEVFNQMTL